MRLQDVYFLDDLKNLPIQIDKLERELKEYEIILNKKDLYQNDRKTFDKVANQITNIKNNISKAEDKWLSLQILKDQINKP